MLLAVGVLSRTLGVLIWPSMITWATCTPCGQNSRAIDWARALRPNLPTASAENRAEPREAVAPVQDRLALDSTIAAVPRRAA